MHHPLVCVSVALLVVACNAAPEPAAGATAPAQPAETPAVAAKPGLDPAKLAERRERLDESRELAQAHAAGTLGDRLGVGNLLLVDARAPAGTDQTRFFLFKGAVASPADLATLEATRGSDGEQAREILQGGEDAGRVAIFRDIGPGKYTVCTIVSGVVGPEQLAYLKKTEEAYQAAGGGPLTPEKIEAAAAKAQAETGYVPQKIDWSALPVNCKIAEVTADPASRVVAFG